MKNQNLIRDKSYSFALSIIALCRNLQNEREYILSKQLLRSGTSIGANVQEALAANSRKDFLYKMTLASKEARESHYWLSLLNDSNLVDLDYQPLLKEATSIVKILTAIVKTTQSK